MSKLCFSYPAGVSPDAEDGGARPDRRMMPATCYSYPQTCFGYPDGMRRGGGNPAPAQPPLSGLRWMPTSTCFRY